MSESSTAEQIGDPSGQGELAGEGSNAPELAEGAEVKDQTGGELEEAWPRAEDPIAYYQDKATVLRQQMVRRKDDFMPALERNAQNPNGLTIVAMENESWNEAVARVGARVKASLKRERDRNVDIAAEIGGLSGIAEGIARGDQESINEAREEITGEVTKLEAEEAELQSKLEAAHNKLGAIEEEGYGEGIEEVTADTSDELLTDYGRYTKYTDLRAQRRSTLKSKHGQINFDFKVNREDKPLREYESGRHATAYFKEERMRTIVEIELAEKRTALDSKRNMLANLNTLAAGK